MAGSTMVSWHRATGPVPPALGGPTPLSAYRFDWAVRKMPNVDTDPPLAGLPLATRSIPRLGIRHMMLWTLCTAAYLVLERSLSVAVVGTGEFTALRAVFVSLNSAVAGAGLAGTVVLIHARVRRGPPFLSHPGHWLLISRAAGILLTSLAFLLVRPNTFEGDFALVWLGLWYCFLLAYLVPTILYLVAAQSMDLHRWRWTFVAMAAFAAFVVVGQYLEIARLIFSLDPKLLTSTASSVAIGRPSLPPALVVVGIATYDAATGERRDWLHWAGVAVFVASACLSAVWVITIWMAM